MHKIINNKTTSLERLTEVELDIGQGLVFVMQSGGLLKCGFVFYAHYKRFLCAFEFKFIGF